MPTRGGPATQLAPGRLSIHATLLPFWLRCVQLYLHHLQETCGAGGLPSGVVRVLNSKACRGAIMFGDELGQEQVGRGKQDLLGTLPSMQWQLERSALRTTSSPDKCLEVSSFLSYPAALQCQVLLGSLAETQLCFSCAHGRPTTAPIVDLRRLRQALELRAAAQLQEPAKENDDSDGMRGRVALSGLKAKLQQLVG